MGGRPRKRYTREFKDGACELVTREGYAPAEAARRLGISPQTLGEWLRAKGWSATADHQAPADSDDPAVLKAVEDKIAAIKAGTFEVPLDTSEVQ